MIFTMYLLCVYGYGVYGFTYNYGGWGRISTRYVARYAARNLPGDFLFTRQPISTNTVLMQYHTTKPPPEQSIPIIYQFAPTILCQYPSTRSKCPASTFYFPPTCFLPIYPCCISQKSRPSSQAHMYRHTVQTNSLHTTQDLMHQPIPNAPTNTV